jgi:hypothetical protein
LYKVIEIPEASLRVENPVNFAFVRVVDDWWLQFRSWQAGGRKFKAVEPREVQNVVLPDYILRFYMGRIFIYNLAYCVQSCQLVIELH